MNLPLHPFGGVPWSEDVDGVVDSLPLSIRTGFLQEVREFLRVAQFPRWPAPCARQVCRHFTAVAEHYARIANIAIDRERLNTVAAMVAALDSSVDNKSDVRRALLGLYKSNPIYAFLAQRGDFAGPELYEGLCGLVLAQMTADWRREQGYRVGLRLRQLADPTERNKVKTGAPYLLGDANALLASRDGLLAAMDPDDRAVRSQFEVDDMRLGELANILHGKRTDFDGNSSKVRHVKSLRDLRGFRDIPGQAQVDSLTLDDPNWLSAGELFLHTPSWSQTASDDDADGEEIGASKSAADSNSTYSTQFNLGESEYKNQQLLRADTDSDVATGLKRDIAAAELDAKYRPGALTNIELRAIYSALGDDRKPSRISSSIWAKARAAFLVLTFFGINVDSLRTIRLRSPEQSEFAGLVVFKSSLGDDWHVTFRRYTPPMPALPTGTDPSQLIRTEPGCSLEMMPNAAAALGQALHALSDDVHTTPTGSYLVIHGKLGRHLEGALKVACEKLKSMLPGTRTEFGRIASAFSKVAINVGVDSGVLYYLNGKRDDQPAQAFYTAVPVSLMVAEHARIQNRIAEAIGLEGACSSSTNVEGRFVGSVRVPRHAVVSDLVNKLWARVCSLSKNRRSVCDSVAHVTAFSDALAISVVAVFGLRRVKNVFRESASWAPELGLLTVADKGTLARTLYMPSPLRNAAMAYRAALIDLSAQLTVLDRDASMIVALAAGSLDPLAAESKRAVSPIGRLHRVAQKWKWQATTTAEMDAAIAAHGLHLPYQLLRHACRSWHVAARTPSDVLDAIMGHHRYGTEPCSHSLWSDPHRWKERIETASSRYADAIGLSEAVRWIR